MRIALTALALALVVGCSDREDEEAIGPLRLAADKGDAIAQYNLGFMYANGQGVLEDDKEAVEWYRKAADQGLAEAQFFLGMEYDNGWGVLEDDKEAVKWYRKAADQGHAAAQHFLGMMYKEGTGVPVDYLAAYAWFNISASFDLNSNSPLARLPHADSEGMRGVVDLGMTPAQIAEAWILSGEILKQIVENKKNKAK